MVSKSIPDPNTGIRSIWSYKGHMFVLSRNPMGHDENIMSA